MLLVEIDSEEVPIMDGSSKDFMKCISKRCNLVEQSKKESILK